MSVLVVNIVEWVRWRNEFCKYLTKVQNTSLQLPSELLAFYLWMLFYTEHIQIKSSQIYWEVQYTLGSQVFTPSYRKRKYKTVEGARAELNYDNTKLYWIGFVSKTMLLLIL